MPDHSYWQPEIVRHNFCNHPVNQPDTDRSASHIFKGPI